MNHIRKRFSKLAIGILTAVLAIALAPVSRAEDQPTDTAATQPAATSSQPAAATSQPTADQRLEELEKEVTLLEQQIASLKEDTAASMKTAAYAEPGSQPAPGINAGGAADDAPKAPTIAGLLNNITLSGFGDVYYGYDNNHPFNNLAGLRSFEAPTNGFNFNMAELILDRPPDATSAESRLGYHVSAGYGYAARVIDGTDNTGFSSNPGFGSNFFVKEAYFSYLAPLGKGLTVTVGKFVTPMGAEVIESNANWNYTRGLLFDYAIPLFHFGASAKYVFNPQWALTGYLVNGWNNTIINHNSTNFGEGPNDGGQPFGSSSGLTYGASLVYTPNMKWSATENYFAGPVTQGFAETGASINDWKQISDTVIAYTPNSKWAFEINGDYGFGPHVYETECSDTVASTIPKPEGFFESCDPGPTVNWWGVAAYAKYNWSMKTNFAARYEYYDDSDGYTGLLADPFDTSFTVPGHAWEVTGTYSYNLTSALLIRGEYRYDQATEPIFCQSFSNFKCVTQQNTVTLGFVYTFSSANLK